MLSQPPHRGLSGGGDQGVLPRGERQPDVHAAAGAAAAAARPSQRKRTPPASSSRRPTGRGRGGRRRPPAGLRRLARRAARAAARSRTSPTTTSSSAAGEEPTPGLVRESFFQQAIAGPDQLRQRRGLRALRALRRLRPRRRRAQQPRRPRRLPRPARPHAFGSFRELLEAVTLEPDHGRLPRHGGQQQGDPRARAHSQRELRPRGPAALLDRPLPAPPRRHAPARRRQPADPDLRPGVGRGLRAGLHRLDARRPAPAPSRSASSGRSATTASRWSPGRSTTRPTRSGCSTAPSCRPGRARRQDLEAALDDIVRHPNVGPFFCRFLIQRLVTSNPSPAYVYRCGQAFADNGAGARGDLAAVVRAVLLDYEARSADAGGAAGLRPPARAGGAARGPAAGARRRRRATAAGALDQLERQSGLCSGQIPLRAPTVFNFFEPGYALPGEIAAGRAGLAGVPDRDRDHGRRRRQLPHSRCSARAATERQLVLDLTPFLPPQAPTDEALLDRVDLLFFAGAMSAETRGILRDALADADFPRQSRAASAAPSSGWRAWRPSPRCRNRRLEMRR